MLHNFKNALTSSGALLGGADSRSDGYLKALGVQFTKLNFSVIRRYL